MSSKITTALKRALAASGGAAVRCAIDVAVDHDRLPLSSFAARATARDAAVMAGITAVMGVVQSWEASNGGVIDVSIRATEGIVEVVGPAPLLESIAELPEAAALDAVGAPTASGRARVSTRTR